MKQPLIYQLYLIKKFMKQPISLQLLRPLKVILQLLQNRRKNDVSTFNYKIEEKNLFVVLY